jgi:RES domain
MSFKSWQSYWEFRTAVTYSNRYIFDEETKSFLEEVLASSKSRQKTIESGTVFWRSQLGNGTKQMFDDEDKVIGDEPCPYPVERMRPLQYEASEGRVNPKGIPCLYLATTKETAMSEVRPWIGSEISVAQFETKKELTVIDCSVNHSANPLYFDSEHGILYEPSEDEREKAVWAYIDKAFSEPVIQNENQAHYAPTQIIAELFKKNGFDGVVYKSMLADGFNIALFDPQVAKLLNCYLYKAKKVAFEFDESANPYFVRKQTET